MKTCSFVYFDNKKAAAVSCFGKDMKLLEKVVMKTAAQYGIPFHKKNLFRNSVTVSSIELGGEYSTGSFSTPAKDVQCVVHIVETNKDNTAAVFNIQNKADMTATKMTMF